MATDPPPFVDRALLARVFLDPRTLLAIENLLRIIPLNTEAAAVAKAAADSAAASAATADANAVAAQASATAAAADAASAQTTANTVTVSTSLNGSYVLPTQVLTATDAGASATITIAGHTRVYADGTQVAVTGGALTGLAHSSSFAIYYDQASRAGGAVTYASTADPATASPSAANPNRHYVGAVVTPAALGAAKLGIGAVTANIALPGGFYS